MKTTILIITSVLIIILISGLYTMTKTKTEIQKYEVVFKKNNFEIRFYPEAVLATFIMNGEANDSANSGFRVLANYIFGGNSENKKIAMTAPVRMTENSNWREMSFVMPMEMQFDKLPEPNDNRVLLHKSGPVYTASVQFGGFANQADCEKYSRVLSENLKELNIQHTNKFELLVYNSPYQIINRRNEVLVELVGYQPGLSGSR